MFDIFLLLYLVWISHTKLPGDSLKIVTIVAGDIKQEGQLDPKVAHLNFTGRYIRGLLKSLGAVI